jgi:hypothetical protein
MSQQSIVQKKASDAEYSRRYNRFFLSHLLVLLPLVVFALMLLVELRYLPWRAIGAAAGCCALVFAFLHGRARREVIAAMRREGLLEEDYEPPTF